MGFALLPLAPELVREKRRALLITLVAGIAVGNTGMQIKDDRLKDEVAADFKLELQKQRLEKWHDLDVKAAEQKLRAKERTAAQPLDAVKNLQRAPVGFRRKADRVSVRASLLESRLMAGHPDLARRMLGFPQQGEARLSVYEAMRAEPWAPQLLSDVDSVLVLLRQEIAYRAAAKFVEEKTVKKYGDIQGAIEGKKLNRMEVSERLHEIDQILAPQVASFRLAGLYNHAGLLAEAEGSGRAALGMYYAALGADTEHIPAYETIAFASWAVNQESRTALEYARQGIALAREYPSALEDERAEISKNYAKVASAIPDLSEPLKVRAARLLSLTGELQELFSKGRATLLARLELLYAYCSALELQNEGEARYYARSLYTDSPTDAEYQDALGLVLLMFAKTKAELDEADRLFELAANNSVAEELTGQLVHLHQAKVDEKRRLLGFEK
jgi:hypothetical protein